MLKYLCLGCFLLLPVQAEAAIVYSMDFSVPGQGATHSGSGTFAAGSATGANWELTWPDVFTDGTLNEYVTVGGVMRVQDWGGDGTTTSNTINIAGDGTVDIAGAGLSIGGDAFNNVGTEGITWFYSLNGGGNVEMYLGETELGGNPVNSGTDVGHTFSNIAVSAGDVLAVGFRVNVNGANDGVEISSLTVDFNAVPEPSSIALLGVAISGLALRRRRS